MGRLDGRVALITGAARGIGEATARTFVAEGARVACADVDAEGVQALATELDGLALGGSVSDPAVANEWVRQIVARFGQLDVLINNAGITRDAMSHKMTMDQWDAVLEVNLKGSFVCAQAAMAVMRERHYGRIVNTASVGAFGNIGQANYSASKAGIVGLTKTLALEGARYDITVNAIAPGFVETPMTAAIPDNIREQQIARIPLRRTCKPEEIARVHLFLASDDAAYITGELIVVDGGLTVGA
ncbi:MAG TPA: 3-oxoacyl-ACP reductase FabG [Chloroflexota bacterium]